VRISARAKASRENGKKSRGPATAAGKNRSSKNAFRHGLATPVLQRPGALNKVRDLTKGLAGERADAELKYLAQKVAETLVEIDMIEARKVTFLSQPWLRFTRYTTRSIISYLRAYSVAVGTMYDLGAKPKPDLRDLKTMIRVTNYIKNWSLPSFAYELVISFEDVANELKTLERYERRAFSKMMRAIRALDQAKVERMQR
jgi:hypothetical protein